MTNGNGQVPSRIVELLITNINELTKQVQQMPGQVSEEIANDLARITVATTTVINKLTTPPRHEELDKKMNDTLLMVDNGNSDIKEVIETLKHVVETKLINKISWMTRSVWLTFTILSIVLIMASLFVQLNN